MNLSEEMNQKLNEKICVVLGHDFIDLDTKKMTAKCKRCEYKFEVSYDMSYGETYAVRKLT